MLQLRVVGVSEQCSSEKRYEGHGSHHTTDDSEDGQVHGVGWLGAADSGVNDRRGMGRNGRVAPPLLSGTLCCSKKQLLPIIDQTMNRFRGGGRKRERMRTMTAELVLCSLPTAHCPRPMAHCSLLTAHCTLGPGSRSGLAARCAFCDLYLISRSLVAWQT
ncbi:hypothetical protein BCR34DRAFT_233024 [Clohesyomyces aquaticus]|uniref:Uncharacterized protein n=1 Tax=Clohesyomyces aquaticus TaxID=1231657 RepID=A0A1Y1ZVZ3_9PLEO|nr:hypothetical protein BCR34DRAFT_233024 [Clohesyomyces aquaticus]